MSYLDELRSMSGVLDYSDRNKLLELAAAKTAETFCAVCEVYAKKGELSHTGPALFAYNDKHYGIKFYPDQRYQIGGNECSLKRSEVDRFITLLRGEFEKMGIFNARIYPEEFDRVGVGFVFISLSW